MSFLTGMQVTNNTIYKPSKKTNFKSFVSLSASVEQNAVLNRALIDAGGVVPWLFKCNNKEERKERIYNLAIFFALAFIEPILNVPLANRIAMKCFGLTDKLSDNNHKAIQLSNEYLVSKEKTLEGLKKYNTSELQNRNKKISEQFYSSPLETLFKKVTKKSQNNTVDIKKLLQKCGNNPELLRRRLIKSKNLVVLCSDLVITGLTLGSQGFLNNYMTKIRTGKAGFSAELEMADAEIIKRRADKYEKNKKKMAAILLSEIAFISAAVPAMAYKGLSSLKKTPFNNFVKKHAKSLDYTKGIYMSRFTMLLGMVMNVSGLILASRNETERKDWTIRSLITIPVFMGGDLVTAGLIAGVSDKLLKTKLVNKNNRNTFLNKIFPSAKTLEQISKEVSNGALSAKYNKIAPSLYWGNMALCAATLAYVVPAICNKMIKNDVKIYIEKNASKKPPDNISPVFKDFQL